LLSNDQDLPSDEVLASSFLRHSQNISDRLIEQFFGEIIEGPDRDWNEEYDFDVNLEIE
jgi:hypothetical protein